MLCERTFKEPMFHRLHAWRPTTWTTLVNLIRDPSLLIVDYHSFVVHRPKGSNFFFSLMLVPNHIPFGTNLALKRFLSFPYNGHEEAIPSSDPLPTRFGWKFEEGVSVQPTLSIRVEYSLCCFTNNDWNYLFKTPLMMMSTLTLYNDPWYATHEGA